MDTREKYFYILCFAICTPQTKYINNKRVNESLIENDFYNKDIPQAELEKIVKPVRFYRNKARYLLDAKKNFNYIIATVRSSADTISKRNEFAKTIKGAGMKVASEFLRDIGHNDIAIIDLHIARYMNKPLPKNKKEYLELEREFCAIARSQNKTPGDLDAEVWKLFSGN